MFLPRATHRPDVLRENAMNNVPPQLLKVEVAAAIRAIFNASDRETAERT